MEVEDAMPLKIDADELGPSAATPAKKSVSQHIQIFLRVRPHKTPSSALIVSDKTVEIDVPLLNESSTSGPNNTRTKYNFIFDHVFNDSATQEQVFETVGKPVVMSALDGYNGTIFAYGQTGSGKTFTITGGAERYVDRGIIPRTLTLAFEEMESVERQNFTYQAFVSYLEIYNENGYDLLDQRQREGALEDMPKLSGVMEGADGDVYVRGLSRCPVASAEAALNLLFLGDTKRAVSSTSMNAASTRSHCIFTLGLEARRSDSDVIRRSKLHIVDLAGSERVAKSNAKGKQLREAQYINQSLHFLEMVIVALQSRQAKEKGGMSHVPYRNSMLTSVLKDSLGGNCKTYMIATVRVAMAKAGQGTEMTFLHESVSTCR
jgi:kinesin family protein 6/9